MLGDSEVSMEDIDLSEPGFKLSSKKSSTAFDPDFYARGLKLKM